VIVKLPKMGQKVRQFGSFKSSPNGNKSLVKDTNAVTSWAQLNFIRRQFQFTNRWAGPTKQPIRIQHYRAKICTNKNAL